MVPASMMILDKTNKQPVLFISGLVVGVHSYNLTVKVGISHSSFFKVEINFIGFITKRNVVTQKCGKKSRI